eukprot:136743-Rhodomonas_salina.1
MALHRLDLPTHGLLAFARSSPFKSHFYQQVVSSAFFLAEPLHTTEPPPSQPFTTKCLSWTLYS